MGWLQAEVEPRRLRRCQTPPRSSSKHLAAGYRPLQQVCETKFLISNCFLVY